MDPKHRQLRQQVKSYLPFFFFRVITIFRACEHYHYDYLQVFLQFQYVRKTLNFY